MNRSAILLAGVFTFAAVPFVLPSNVLLLNYIGLGSILVLGLTLMTGVGGITSFGQAAFAGIGAYVTAVLTTRYGISPWLGLLAALAVTVAATLILGLVTLRLSGHFLPIGTLAWCIALSQIIGNTNLLGGHNGLSGIPPLSVAEIPLLGDVSYFYFIWGIVALSVLSIVNLLNSRVGRAIRGLASPAMARAFGVNVPRTRMLLFVYAGILATISGWLYAHYVRYINPTPFGLIASIEYLFMAVVGGVASISGAIVGVSVVTFLRHWFQELLPTLIGRPGQFEIIFFGLMIVLVFQRAPRGIVPSIALRFLKPRPVAPPRDAAPLTVREVPERGGVLINASRISKRYGGLTALDDMSFELHCGEFLGLIGPNGAGKTTLLNILSSAITQDSGTIVFCGNPIEQSNEIELARRGLSRTFQHPRFCAEMSVLENVALGAHLRGGNGVVPSLLRLNRDEEASLLAEARRRLQQVYLEQKMNHLAGTLPLGDQRLMEVARALAADPIVLLLDEPAAGLRAGEKALLASLLRKLRDEGLTILMIEHDMEFLMDLVDRVVVINFGRKIAEGTPTEVQSNSAVIEAYLGADP